MPHKINLKYTTTYLKITPTSTTTPSDGKIETYEQKYNNVETKSYADALKTQTTIYNNNLEILLIQPAT